MRLEVPIRLQAAIAQSTLREERCRDLAFDEDFVERLRMGLPRLESMACFVYGSRETARDLAQDALRTRLVEAASIDEAHLLER